MGHAHCGWCVKAPPMVGPTWARVHLTLGSDCLPQVVSGDCLAFLLYASFIVRLCLSNVRWYRVVLVRRFLYSWFVYAALGAILLDHMCVHLHGSLYPMMDHTLRVCYVQYYIFIGFLHLEIHWNQYKTTKHLNGFDTHCMNYPPHVCWCPVGFLQFFYY